MKKMELTQMENLQGGNTPSGDVVACFVCSSIMGFICPVVGLLQGVACLFV